MGKKAIDLKGISRSKQKFIDAAQNATQTVGQGLNNSNRLEGIPRYISAMCEVIYEGKNNTLMRMGRDKPGYRQSGYGGKGDTHCGMIDIVAGRQGANSKDISPNGDRLYSDTDLRKDSARIYMSQKADVDEYFKLADGEQGSSEAKSALAMKADDVRVISRQGIKLVTGTDPKNSQGGKVRSAGGIDLIAGNNDRDIQPLLKGDITVKFLQEVVEKINRLDGTLLNFVQYQIKFNFATMFHQHRSPLFAFPTGPDVDILPQAGVPPLFQQIGHTIPAIIKHKLNLKLLDHNYLSGAGKSYICSRNNNTN